MALSAFDDPAHPPGPADLSRSLGASAPLWKAVVTHVGKACAPVTEAWSCSGAKFGWSLRLKRAERVLVYLTPQEGRFLVGIVLGEKAIASGREKGRPAAVTALLDAAPRYAEGRGVRLTIAPGDDLEAVRHLVAMKAEVPPKGRGRTAGAGGSRK
jgi:hypothetical protein